jgi:sensor histidine kinase YesM
LVDQNQIFFSNLSPGRYIFQAKAVNKDGVESEMLEFYFAVSAPIYYKMWFWFLLAFLFGGLTYWIVKKRIHQIKAKANEVAEKLRLEKEVLEMEQKALRLQMNPHFIFNALNAIQDQIRAENNKGARHSLNKFSKLMRQILDSSRTDYISLELELNILDNYLNIEKLARNNSFEYTIDVNSEIDTEEEGIPPMMVQPFLENAIIHGVAGIESVGTINISFSTDKDFLWVKVEDNGVGIKKAKQLKSQKAQQHKSVALEVIQSRLQNLSNEEFSSCFSMEDKVNGDKVSGTLVHLKIKRQVVW